MSQHDFYDSYFMNSLSRVLSTEEGKEVFRELFERAGLVAGGAGGLDPLYMAMTEGRRALGREFWNLIQQIDSKYLQIINSKLIERRVENERGE